MTRRAFTLLELLVVIAIIAILAALSVAGAVSVAESARVAQTSSRMQAVLNALTSYRERDGGATMNLQAACGLGGVVSFATVDAIVASVPAASAKPPAFTHIMGAASRVLVSHANFAAGADADRIRLWERLSHQVFDAMPPEGATWVAADYLATWPLQWPETDWDLATPGTNPPILRFPWGKPGLRIDGTLCDPSLPDALGYPSPTRFKEQAHYRGQTFRSEEPNGNSWATFDSASTGRIWRWTSQDTTQTDWVTLGIVTRSDGTTLAAGAVPANKAIPFDMGWMSPLKTIALLQAAGVVAATAAGEEAYRTDRGRKQPWNDAWGRPLVVVYALFQPERYTRDFDGQNRRDLMLRGARAAYQYDRSLYLAIGSQGPVPAPGTADSWAAAGDAMALRDHWMAIRDVCEAHLWDETAFTAPPWKDLKKGKRLGRKSLLTSPVELK